MMGLFLFFQRRNAPYRRVAAGINKQVAFSVAKSNYPVAGDVGRALLEAAAWHPCSSLLEAAAWHPCSSLLEAAAWHPCSSSVIVSRKLQFELCDLTNS
jgi:hypothetical protein